jgi:HAMP domain-containing protein
MTWKPPRLIHMTLWSTAITVVAALIFGLFLEDQFTGLRRQAEKSFERTLLMSGASYELEINAIGFGLGVFKYLETGEPDHVRRVEEDSREFRDFQNRYLSMAVTPQELELASRVSDLWESYEIQGRALLVQRDEIAALEPESFSTLARFESVPQLRELATAIELCFLSLAKACSEDRETDLLRRLESVTTELSAAGGPALRGQFPDLTSARVAIARIGGILASRRALRGGIEALILLRRQLDDLLDEEIQAVAENAVAEQRQQLAVTRGKLGGWLLVVAATVAATTLASIALALFVDRGLARLAAEADRVGRGELDAPIDVGGSREIQSLARRLDEMREQLRESMVSRHDYLRSEAGLARHLRFDRRCGPGGGVRRRHSALEPSGRHAVRQESGEPRRHPVFRCRA